MRLSERKRMWSCMLAGGVLLCLALPAWPAVIVRVTDLTPEHGRISHRAAFGLFAIEVDVTNDEC